MATTNLTPEYWKAYAGHHDNPDHPSWKLPPHVAYEATEEELRAVRKLGAQNPAASHAAAVPTGALVHGVPVGLSPVAPAAISAARRPAVPKTQQQIKANAAEAIGKAYARHGPQFRIQVKPLEQWEHEGKAVAERDGCDVLEGMYRCGFVCSTVSLPPVGR